MDDKTLPKEIDNVDKLLDVAKYCVDNPIILLGISLTLIYWLSCSDHTHVQSTCCKSSINFLIVSLETDTSLLFPLIVKFIINYI